MYVTIRKYRMKVGYEQVHDAVMTGLVPLLRESKGFQGYWSLRCDDGDVAGMSMFDTEQHAIEAQEHTRAWVVAHIRDYVVLPPEAMFGGEVSKLA
jgi:heme-degrading monooxygenase HmoA